MSQITLTTTKGTFTGTRAECGAWLAEMQPSSVRAERGEVSAEVEVAGTPGALTYERAIEAALAAESAERAIEVALAAEAAERIAALTLDQAIEAVLSEVHEFPFLRPQSEFHDGPPTCAHDRCPTGRCTAGLLRAELAGAAVGAPAPEIVCLPAHPRPGIIVTAPFWDLVLRRMGLAISGGRYVRIAE